MASELDTDAIRISFTISLKTGQRTLSTWFSSKDEYSDGISYRGFWNPVPSFPTLTYKISLFVTLFMRIRCRFLLAVTNTCTFFLYCFHKRTIHFIPNVKSCSFMVLKRSFFGFSSIYAFFTSELSNHVSRLSRLNIERSERLIPWSRSCNKKYLNWRVIRYKRQQNGQEVKDRLALHDQDPTIKNILIWELFVTKGSKMDWTGQGYECNQYGEEEEYEEEGKYTI